MDLFSHSHWRINLENHLGTFKYALGLIITFLNMLKITLNKDNHIAACTHHACIQIAGVIFKLVLKNAVDSIVCHY